eukprot:751960-Heterocapsa_arctica.AAC.1
MKQGMKTRYENWYENKSDNGWQHGVFIPLSRVCVHTLFKGMKQGYGNGYENAMACYRGPVRDNV